MATLDWTRQSAAIPRLVIDELFDTEGNWQSDEPASEDYVTGSETIVHSDELTREAVSMAARPVVIEITDEQAEQFLAFGKRGALSR